MKNFLEEDPNTLEYRNCLDIIDNLHSANYYNYASLFLKQNKSKEALEKVEEGLQKIDHRHMLGNFLKVEIMRVMNRYEEARQVLSDLGNWYPD